MVKEITNSPDSQTSVKRNSVNEEEFLKEHPSLKGRLVDCGDCCAWQYVKDEQGEASLLVDIHKTQIDKAKVKEAFENLLKEWRERGGALEAGYMDRIPLKDIWIEAKKLGIVIETK